MSSQSNSADRSTDERNVKEQESLQKQIKDALAAGKYQKAEALRDLFIEKEPMAINEAIKLGDMIEKEMSAAVDREHLAIWPELYDNLTVEERNCLFHSMKLYVLPEKRMLLKYGSLNNKLFFLEKGKVTVAVPQESGKFKVLGQMGRGDVLGEYTFATIALCSATAVTKTSVQIRCLEGKTAEGWEEKQPGLYAKVLEFCQNHGRIDLISARKEQESHTHQRYTVPGRVKASLLDKDGKQTELNFNGELEEISRSGLSFSIHCNQKETVQKLLTRSFSLNISCGNVGKEFSFSSSGKVVRVSFLLYNDYLLHIGFHAKLSEELDKRLSS